MGKRGGEGGWETTWRKPTLPRSDLTKKSSKRTASYIYVRSVSRQEYLVRSATLTLAKLRKDKPLPQQAAAPASRCLSKTLADEVVDDKQPAHNAKKFSLTN